MAERKLKPRQESFVFHYIRTLNAAEAYKAAGYKVKNENVARVEGHRLLTNPNVQAAIRKATESKRRSERGTVSWIIRRLEVEACRKGEGATHSARIRALELLGKTKGLFQTLPPLEVMLATVTGELGEYARRYLAGEVRVIEGARDNDSTGPIGARIPSAVPDSNDRPDGDPDAGGNDPGPVAGGPTVVPLEQGPPSLFPPIGEKPSNGSNGSAGGPHAGPGGSPPH